MSTLPHALAGREKAAPASLQQQNLWSTFDLLRGFAATGVVLFHLTDKLWIGSQHFWSSPAQASVIPRAGAWTAALCYPMYSLVMLFFVVSGFCIHYSNAGRQTPLDVRRFYRRRFMRIYPPYLAAILLTLAISCLLLHNFIPILFSRRLILKNVLMLQGGLGINGALWALPVEMELYLVYPLLLFGTKKMGWAWTLAIVTVVSLTAAGFAWHATSLTKLHFPLFWIIWFSGMILAELWRTDRWPVLRARWLLVAIGAGIFGHLIQPDQQIVMWLPWGACYFIFVWFLLTQIRRLKTNLRSIAWLRFPLLLGAMSYSLYLIHSPILSLIGHFALGQQGDLPSNFFISLGLGSLCLLPAAGFYLMVERPSHRFARRFK
jgi:peptidoglycan/LPS O-acetylase OafA/YrhL